MRNKGESTPEEVRSVESKELRGQRQLPYQPDDYADSIMWSEEDRAYVGRVAEFAALAAHGPSPALALREITEVVGCALED